MSTDGNDDLVRSFARDLRSRNRSPQTITNYADALRVLRLYLDDTDLAAVTRPVIVGFYDWQLETLSATTVAIRHRALQQFYKWATAEGICGVNPMVGVSAPMVPVQPVPVLSVAQVKALLATCQSKEFADVRDDAVIRLFLEPGGLRLAEMAGLGLADLDLDIDVVYVTGKGRRERVVPFGAKPGKALDRYARARRTHPSASLAALWLGPRGAFTRSGIQQMLRRRAVEAGIGHLHPHMLRHTAAHEWLAAGGQETDAMILFGWKSRSMLERYGASGAVVRAQAASRNLGLGDRY